MIWLLTNVWWLVPVLIVVLASLSPAGWALVRRVPVRVWLVVLAVALLGLSFQAGRWHERSQHRSAQEAAESQADAKAVRVAKDAGAKADESRATFQKETQDVQVRIREVVRTVPATCPPMPDELRELLQRQVQGARDAVQAGSGRSDR